MFKCILIVDDEPDMAEFVADVMEMKNITPIIASSGKQALQLLADNQVIGIISDIVMPDMDGIEFIQKLAKQGAAVPIVLMSGYHEHYIEMGKIIGMDKGLPIIGTLTKPFPVDQILEMICVISDSAN